MFSHEGVFDNTQNSSTLIFAYLFENLTMLSKMTSLQDRFVVLAVVPGRRERDFIITNVLNFVQRRVMTPVFAISNMFSQGGVFDNAKISDIFRSRKDGHEGRQGDGFDNMMV